MTEEVDFNSLQMNISPLLKRYSIEDQKNVFAYLQQLDEQHRIAYEIAYNHLGDSFSVIRSNGFKEWLKQRMA